MISVPAARPPRLLAGLALCAITVPGVWSDEAAGPDVMPLSELETGMGATVQTVFEGGKVEEFQAEIVGILDNFLGPNHSLIIARLNGANVERTGVAAGMSGSPVYVDGRLIGALSYRLGNFLTEPMAGITPIEYMLGMTGAGARRDGELSSRPAGLVPIETPIAAVGVPSAVLDAFGPDLEPYGLSTVMAGAAGGVDSPSPGSAPLLPGQAVAAQLVTGDLSLAATGTVTLVRGDAVYAFGHPTIMNGATEVPMARADVIVTIPSLQASTKMSRVLDTIGTFRQSRLPGVTGVIGPVPKLLPVTVKVASAEASPRSFHFNVINHLELTPVLVGIVTGSSILNTAWSSDEMTIMLSGRIGMNGHSDVILNDVYTGFSASQPAAISLARDVQGLFQAVFQNRFEEPTVESVELEVSTIEKGSVTLVEGVYPSRTEVEVGDEVEFRVLLRPFRGDPYTRSFSFRIPEGIPEGPLLAYVGGANVLAAVERNILSQRVRQVDDLNQLISLVNDLRTNNKLYITVNRRGAGAVVQSEVLPSLPPSVYSTLRRGGGQGDVSPLAETTIHEDSIALDQIVVGGTRVILRVQ